MAARVPEIPDVSSVTHEDLIREISPDDVTFTHSLAYFEQGLTALRCIVAALQSVPTTRPRREVKRILDLPCGHGRVLRGLRAAFPEAEITACDITTDGVDFCAETFDAIPVYSNEDPARIELSGEFDLIWCGSLFTHLDTKAWDDFLDLFEAATAEDGLIVFTTHGRGVVDQVRRNKVEWGISDAAKQSLVSGYEASGFAFQAYPHDPSYGLSVSAPSWVCGKIEERPNLRLVTYGELAWNGFQDIVSCVRRPTEGVRIGFDAYELT